MLLAGTVLTPAGAITGEVLVEGNLITCVAPSCRGMAAAADAHVVTTTGVIMPGMIDTHNHGLFGIFDEGDWTPGVTYASHSAWESALRYTQVLDAQQYLSSAGASPVDLRCEMIKYAEVKALIAGTTSYVAAPGTSLACYGSVLRTVDTFQNDLADDKVSTATAVPSDASATTTCAGFAGDTIDAYLVHVGEGTNTTALNEFLTLQGRAGGCLMAPQTAIVHGTALGPTQFAAMAAAGMKLVWSPSSDLWFYGATTAIHSAITAGVTTIALASNWAISGSSNLLEELKTAAAVDASTFGDVLTSRRLVDMVTVDAAKVLALDAQLGTIAVGKRADLTIVNAGGPADPYDAVVAATPARIGLVLVDGKPLYGDVAHLAGMPAGGPPCDTVDICGTSKFLCLAEASTANKLDQTFAAITAALSGGLADYDALVAPEGIAPFSPIAPLTACP